MRIGIALFQFFPGRVGGAGDYIERLVPGLIQALQPDDELILFGNSENLAPFASLHDSRFHLLSVPWSRRWIQTLRFLDIALPFSASRFFSRQFNRLRLDVLLCPQQSIFPRGIDVPTVVTVVDLLHYRTPEHVSRWQRWLRRRKEIHVIQNCVHTISISQATRADLLEFYPIAPEKCSVVYLGGKAPHNDLAANPVPAGAPYVYYPATSFPHKNHARLLAAFRAYQDAHSPRPARLVLSGQCSPELRRLLDDHDLARNVLHLGYITRSQVAAVYNECRAVVIPSLFEGFGMPLVEGLGFSRPVFFSDLPVFRELAGDVVNYFDPTSIESLKSTFERIFGTDPTPPDPAAVAEILGRLNWERCATETYRILKENRRS
ncbi:MAG: glycosyltransferase, MtfB-like family [Planctomycetaceae bacterium]|nr:glycosyltransferase, MtfB-like family [Planctomycetaceae bacterium]